MKDNRFLKTTIQGLFWLIPIIVILILSKVLLDKLIIVNKNIVDFIGLNSDEYLVLIFALGIVSIVLLSYAVGYILNTVFGDWINKIIHKIPFYKNLTDFINLFNSAKSGKKDVLIVAIKGFGQNNYNIGLMYNTNESIIKGHYSVVISHMPLNGGFIFEVPGDEIYVIKEATFNNNFEYLLTSASSSLADIMKIEPIEINKLPTLIEFKEE
ncbi:MAG: DUF502 domain-containing protein [Campylobacterota bacterium]|nr:DUF502 domain-containing protein [Campylobacterota bacterium]